MEEVPDGAAAAGWLLAYWEGRHCHVYLRRSRCSPSLWIFNGRGILDCALAVAMRSTLVSHDEAAAHWLSRVQAYGSPLLPGAQQVLLHTASCS